MPGLTEFIRTTCPRDCYDAEWRDPHARLTTPLKQVGPKGEGELAPISWEEALEQIAARLKPILAESGGGSVIQTHYTGTFSLIGYAFPLRFFHKIGATEVDPDTVCNKAGHAALEAIFGTSMNGFDPRSAGRRPASSSGARTRPPPPRTPTSTGWRRHRARSSSSTPSGTRPRKPPICTCSRSPARTPRWRSPCCTSSGGRACWTGRSWRLV